MLSLSSSVFGEWMEKNNITISQRRGKYLQLSAVPAVAAVSQSSTLSAPPTSTSP